MYSSVNLSSGSRFSPRGHKKNLRHHEKIKGLGKEKKSSDTVHTSVEMQ